MKDFVELAGKTILGKECNQSANDFLDKFKIGEKSLGMRSLKSKQDKSVNKEELISSIQSTKLCN